MRSITNKFSSINDKLNLELDLIKKYKIYSTICSNDHLKLQFEQVYKQHQNQYNSLLNQIN